MTKFTFDVRLKSAFTLEADSEETARAALTAILDCAEINCGTLPDGEPLLGEATMTRAVLAMIDGEDAPALTFPSPLHYYAAAREHGWYPGDEDTPEEFCATEMIEENYICTVDTAFYAGEFLCYDGPRI